MRNLSRALALMSSASFIVLGCTKPDANGTNPSASASAAQSAGAVATPSASASTAATDLAAILSDGSGPITPQVDEAILLSLEKCSLKACKPFDFGIETSCPAWNNHVSTIARKRDPAATDRVPAYLLKHLDHASPAVRYHAAFKLSGLQALREDTEAQGKVIAAVKKEAIPNVRAQLLSALGPLHAKNETVKTLLLENADHTGECVRMMSMWPFLKKEGKGVPGTFDKVVEKLASDPAPMVRRYLCSSLYGSENEKAIPLFEKYLGAKDTPEEVFTGCFEGAIAAWVSAAYPDNPNAKAYELSMRVLEATPRTEARPPWVQIKPLKFAKTEFAANDHLGPAWYAKVKPWYKRERLQTALVALVSDPRAHRLARAEAIDVLGQIGTPKATLTQLATKLGSLKGDDASVKTKLDALVAQR